MTLSFAFSRTTFYAAFRYAKIKMQVKCKSKSSTFIDTLSVWKFKWRVRILPPQPSKEQVLLCLFFVFLQDSNLRRFARSEKAPAERFQRKARGRYRTQSVRCPERTVCEGEAVADGRILPPQPSKEQVLLCLFFVFFRIRT